jgi:hypothetical protein
LCYDASLSYRLQAGLITNKQPNLTKHFHDEIPKPLPLGTALFVELVIHGTER